MNTKDFFGEYGYSYLYFDEINSTNTYLKDNFSAENTVVIAKRQSAGRGRLGRSFISNNGGLYMSFTVPLVLENPAMITARAAVAVSAVVDLIGGKSEIKWVNDIYLHGKKLCGILCEARRGGDAVIGIGVNVYGDIPTELKDIATSLDKEKLGTNVPSIEWLGCKIFEAYMSCDDFFDKYRRKQLIIGKAVTVHEFSGTCYRALAKQINDDCSLSVVLEDGSEKSLSSAEVSVTKADDFG